jgi:hypothetical protein
MTSMPPHDPLVALWQTAPKPDTHNLLQDLQRLNRLHQRHNRSIWAIMCGIAILLIFEEATGRLASHGILSAIWILGLIIGVLLQRRARCNRVDALTLDTVSLLKFMIARAKKDLFVARCLYAGVPCGAAVGFMLTKLAGIGPSQAVGPRLNMIQTGAGIAALIAMMVTGVILARSRRLQVQDLTEKLRSINADL